MISVVSLAETLEEAGWILTSPTESTAVVCVQRVTEYHLTFGYLCSSWVAQLVKNPPAVQETWVGSLGQGDPLEKGLMPSSILAWIIPWTEDPGGL